MKLEMQMAERDKKLLIFLAIFVIVVGIGYWGIIPQIKNIMSIGEQKEEAEYQQMIGDMKLVELPMLEIENEELEKDILDARNHFYKMMTSDEIDKYMTGMVLGYNLYSYSLSISMPEEEASLSAYMYSAKYEIDRVVEEERIAELEMEQKEEARSESKGVGSSAERDQLAEIELMNAPAVEYDGNGLTGIYAASVEMQLGGAREDLQKLIDDLSVSKEKIWLKNYSWSYIREVGYSEETGQYEEIERPVLNISANLYMCEE